MLSTELKAVLPPSLSNDDIVVVVGKEDFQGMNTLKSLINKLNRNGKWINPVFNTNVSMDQISDKAQIILTMIGMSAGSLANVRKAAKNKNVFCPNQAILVSQVKEILGILAERRPGQAQSPQKNDKLNGSLRVPEPSTEQRLGSSVPWDYVNEMLEENSNPSESLAEGNEAKEANPASKDHQPEELDDVISAINDFAAGFSRVQDAVLAVNERYKAVIVERSRLEQEVQSLQQELAQFREQSTENQRMSEAYQALEERNNKLEGEVERLKGALDRFEKLFREIRGA